MRITPDIAVDQGRSRTGEGSTWRICRIKFEADLNSSKSAVAGLAPETEVSFIPMEAIGIRGEVDPSRSRSIEAVLSGYTYVADGDVLLAKITPCFENGKCGVAESLIGGIGFATTEVIPIRPRLASEARFLFYLLTSEPFRSRAKAEMYGAGGQKRVPDSFVAEYECRLPPHRTRLAISQFLDHETTRIDSLIDKQKQLIELLKEKRQAVISQAVTKGLDLSVPMKSGGVEWLTETPVSWTPSRIKFVVSKVADGPHFSPSYVDEGVPMLSARNVRVDCWELESAKFISEADADTFDQRIVPRQGDVLLTKGGTTGVARAVDLDFRFQVWVHIAVLRVVPSRADPEYIAFALNSDGCYSQSQLFTRGATNNDLGLTRIPNIWFALPTLKEQREIVAWLQSRLQAMDECLGRVRTAISLLEERRSALISAAVTGQIDIPDHPAASEPAAA